VSERWQELRDFCSRETEAVRVNRAHNRDVVQTERLEDALEALTEALEMSGGTPQTAQRSLPDSHLLQRAERAEHARDVAERSVGLLEEALRAIAEALATCRCTPASLATPRKHARRALAGVETGPGKDEQGNAGGTATPLPVVEPGQPSGDSA
jgi:hypothetical protein